MAVRNDRSPARTFALVVGAVYLLIGILGFFVAEEVTGGSADDKLLGFPVNHLHNVVHLAIGAVLLAASRAHSTAKTWNLVIGGTLLLVALLGFTGAGFMHTLLNIHGTGSADNFLHLITGALAVYFGTVGAGDRTGARTGSLSGSR